MNSTCIAGNSYLASADFLHLFLHIITIIGTPIHVLGALIILLKTPTTMSSVKWPMLNLHFWSSILDVSVGSLTCPVVLFPAFAGYTTGVLGNWGVPTWLQFHAVITLIGLVMVAMISVYENRYFIIAIQTGVWEKLRVWFLAVINVLGWTFLIPFTATFPEQQNAVNVLFIRLPCLTVDRSLVFVYTFNLSAAFFVSLVLLLSAFVLIGTFFTLTIRNLLKNNATHSQKTLKLQKRFLFGLMVQTSIPVIVVFGPFSYLAFSIVKEYYNQSNNNILVIAFSTHGFLSTVAMLLVHQPYRHATWNILKSFPRRRPGSHNQIADRK